MGHKLNIDQLDFQIIQEITSNSELTYQELGKKLSASPGTIHLRVKKLTDLGVIRGKKYEIGIRELGYDIVAFVGIYLEKSSQYDEVAASLQKIPQVVRANYTTGAYSMFIEIVCKNIEELRTVLHDGLQKIQGIQRTETLISLQESFNRPISIEPDIA